MNQVSRPMQIALAAVLVFAALWFVALKPKDDAAEPVAAGPATPAATSPKPVDAGGAAASSTLGKAVESANNAASSANAATKQREQQTGDTPASAPAATTPAGTTPATAAQSAPAANASTAAAAKTKGKSSARSASQRRADRLTEAVGKHLAAGRAVVVLVSSPTGSEDKILRKRVKNEINRRGGRVRVYFISVSKVGLYEGLLGSLNLGQTPSTIVIAPNNEAKVLGGLVSTARLDRLTSAALLLKPAKTK
jgi:hypothetical protein